MKAPGLIFENFFVEQLGMPLLWQLIYQEAMRGNHLLFDREDLLRFESEASPILSADDQKTSDFVYSIFENHDLTSIQTQISQLSFGQKRRVHQVYRRFLDRWRFQLKQGMN